MARTLVPQQSEAATPAIPARFGLGRLRRESRRTSGWGGLLYILPAFAILILFEFWPIVFSIWISLWRWDVRPLNFIGLDNYRQLFGDGMLTRDYNGNLVPGEVLNSLIVTVYYVIGTVPITLAVAFVLAYMLFRGVKGEGILRTLYFLPNVTASVAVTLVFAWIFNAQTGLANALFDWIGLPVQTWLMDPNPALREILDHFGIHALDNVPDWAAGPSQALVVIIIFSIWSSLGFAIIVYLSGLTSISRDLSDAARLDGATEWTIMRTVIWPLLSPTTFFLLVVSTINAFQAFNPIYTLTRNSNVGRSEAGGPLDTTLTITVYIYRNFYERANGVGYAAAVSLLLFFILLALTLLQFRVAGRRVHYQ
ncbi:MAG TPA: sugar ABC transporter permease [Thermomicrobiales bacterium]|nr:sugar ABC transporter permease [Thermomicrobiales bacterium]